MTPPPAPALGSCTSSGHTWRFWAHRHFREEAGSLGAPPQPRVLKLAATKTADFAAFDHRRHRSL